MRSSQRRQYQQFKVHPRGFVWQGAGFGFTQIDHLSYSRLDRRDVDFEAATLVITVNYEERIRLSFESEDFRYADDIENLRLLYTFLSRQTFSHRLQAYLSQLEQAGHFEYEGYRFHPPHRITRGSRSFSTRAVRFHKGSNYVELRRRNPGFLHRLWRKLAQPLRPRFQTQTDTDVIFYLLDKKFGLRWKH